MVVLQECGVDTVGMKAKEICDIKIFSQLQESKE